MTELETRVLCADTVALRSATFVVPQCRPPRSTEMWTLSSRIARPTTNQTPRLAKLVGGCSRHFRGLSARSSPHVPKKRVGRGVCASQFHPGLLSQIRVEPPLKHHRNTPCPSVRGGRYSSTVLKSVVYM